MLITMYSFISQKLNGFPLQRLKPARLITGLALILLTAIALPGCDVTRPEDKAAIDAFANVGLKKNREYTVLKNPLPVDTANSVSVLEFFWYGCGHCYKIESAMQKWTGGLPSYVTFEKVPAMWDDAMELHARAHYIAEKLRAPGMQEALFPLIMQIRKSTDLDEHKAQIENFFARYYIAKDEFEKLWNDEEIINQVRRADDWQRQAKVSGTPAIVINGRFMVHNPSFEDVTHIVPAADKMVRALLSISPERSN